MNESEWGLLLGMREMGSLLERWQIDEGEVRRQTYREAISLLAICLSDD